MAMKFGLPTANRHKTECVYGPHGVLCIVPVIQLRPMRHTSRMPPNGCRLQ